MFDVSATRETLQQVQALSASLDEQLTDADRMDLIARFEELKNTLAAAQAELTDDLAGSRREQQRRAGVPRRRLGQGLGQEVGAARRESPHRGTQLVGLAKVLVPEMPHTFAGMTQGWLSEYRATLLARETACLTLEDRRRVDAALAGDRDRIEHLSNRRLEAEAKRLAGVPGHPPAPARRRHLPHSVVRCADPAR